MYPWCLFFFPLFLSTAVHSLLSISETSHFLHFPPPLCLSVLSSSLESPLMHLLVLQKSQRESLGKKKKSSYYVTPCLKSCSVFLYLSPYKALFTISALHAIYPLFKKGYPLFTFSLWLTHAFCPPARKPPLPTFLNSSFLLIPKDSAEEFIPSHS